ncbi:flagellar export chaperone FlgN [Planctobacterium marinum]|uniref:flagellar export chaperone FlgN n=1 Tax=Planctobacterium marinum TaxID=1631968 RepID=UPI001E3D0DF3|nr:flagellar export chaperone FlgN [Planctobacterium marinum]MCC2606289.1 flagellar protein FlgN [Planctobacterium marinum]
MSDMTNALTQQISLLQALKEKLDNELELIVARDADGLLTLVNEKSDLLEQIAENDKVLQSARLSSGEFNDAQRQLAENGKALLLQCQHQTNVNAIAVEKNQIRLQRLRDVMMATRNKESMTYTNKGKTQGGMLGSGVKA